MAMAQSAKSDSLFAIGIELYNVGKYQDAIPVFEACDKLDKAELDSTSNRRDYSSMWLASCYYHIDDSLTAASTYVNYKLKPVDRRLTIKSDSIATIADDYFSKDDFENALHNYLIVAEMEKSVLGEDHPYYGNTIAMCLYTCENMGNYTEAIKYGKEALSIREKQMGRNTCLTILSHLANCHYNLKEYTEAINIGKEVTNISGIVFGKESNEQLISISNLASYYFEIGNFTEAMIWEKEALTIIERLYGKKNLNYASSLSNLGQYCNHMGNNAKAIQYEAECLEILEELLGKEHPYYAISLGNIALYKADIGDYPEAISLGEKAHEILLKTRGEKDSNYSSSLNNLALFNSYIGNYYKAIQLVTEGLRIDELTYGKNNPNYAISLNNLALFHSHIGNYEEAIQIEKDVLDIFGTTVGKNNSKYVIFLNNLALFYSYFKNYTKALEIAEEALAIYERLREMNGSYYSTLLKNIAVYNSLIGNYSNAIFFENKALQSCEQTLGKEHIEYSNILGCLAYDLFHNNDNKTFSDILQKTTDLKKDFILRNFTALSSSERNKIWEKNKEWFTRMIHYFSYRCKENYSATNAYNGILFSKGLLLNSEMEIKKLLKAHGDKDVLLLYDDIQANRMLLDFQYTKPIKQRSINTDSLEINLREKERELNRMSRVYGDYTKNLKISWQDVQAKLGQKDMSVEFVSFPLTNDSTMYVAYVLKKGMTSPKMIPLFEEKQLKKGEDPYKNTSVGKLVWEPLAEYLDGIQNVYFAPAGELYNIGIEYLPHWSGEGRMSEKWNIYRLSSTRQLAVAKDKNALKQASVYGGVVYDTKEDILIADSRKYHSQERSFNYEPFAIADSLGLRSGVSYLEATKTEAEEVDKILRQNNINSTLKIDTLATEGAFKDLSGKKINLLHIATHGFYFTEDDAKPMTHWSFLQLNDNQQKYVEDKSLNRSGLFLAGANYSLKGKKLPEGVDDGILTAKEISQIDLRGLDLAVLAACETGLGDIKGDGVFGLQRGFKKAGANSLLMSLWKVKDEATQLLMTQFYKNLTSGMSKFESLRDAQRYVREYEKEVEVGNDVNSELATIPELAQDNSVKKAVKKIKKYQDPIYWAAFILLDAID